MPTPTPRGQILTGIEEIPVIGLRRKIAEKMVESKTKSPLLLL